MRTTIFVVVWKAKFVHTSIFVEVFRQFTRKIKETAGFPEDFVKNRPCIFPGKGCGPGFSFSAVPFLPGVVF